MKKLLIVFVSSIFTLFPTASDAQKQYKKEVRPTKNVILMIPDGCALSVYSAARWFKLYNDLGGDGLAVDPYICGTVSTHCSNAPIGDSAPTTACYMTGYLSQTGNISIYPMADRNQDIFPIDSTRAYQPLATVLEAAKYDLNKSTGLVATIHFSHATPADCSSHYYNRSRYDILSKQQVANKLDVVISSGNTYLTPELEEDLRGWGTKIIRNDVDALRADRADSNMWALFHTLRMPYDIDRDSAVTPSLAEMTQKAIDRLSQDEDGFFLMVEGSLIDHSAHSHEAHTVIREYLAFDNAVGVAIDFAKADGETAVIVLSDHATGGFSIGRTGMDNFSRRGLDDLFQGISKIKCSTRKLTSILKKSKPDHFKSIIKEYTDVDITDEELELLLLSKDYSVDDYMEVSNSVNLASSMSEVLNKRNFFGFSSGGHTGEEVLLSVYHPDGDLPIGMNTNIELNHYLCDVVGLQRPLDKMTDEVFAKHTEVFKGYKYSIEADEIGGATLTVKKGRKTLSVPAFASKVYLNGEQIELRSTTVYIDKNETFYLPRELVDLLAK